MNHSQNRRKKIAIVSVINDLVTDQRVHKSCMVLQQAGFEVLLVGRKQRKSPPMDSRPYQTKRMRLIFEKGPCFYAFFNLRLFLFLLFHKADFLLSNDLDTLLPNYLISKIKRIPILYDSHEYFTETPELVNRKFVQSVWKKIEASILPHLKEMITVNESIANLFGEKYHIQVHVIRNIPMRADTLSKGGRETLHLPLDKHLLVLQGSGINVHRGAEELVEAMHFLDDSLLMIIGGGDVLPILKQKVQLLNLQNVLFLPRMPYSEMMDYTCCAELGFSLDKDTNLNYRFSLPNKLFDYIQANVPVIASHLPEIEKVIKKYDIGDFIEDHQPEHIASSVRNALDNRERYQNWKRNLSHAAEELCWEKESLHLLEIYKRYNG